MPRILSIDFGLKRSGLAVTDPLKIIANPLDTIETNFLIPYLEKYLKAESVECFVVGDPKNLDNTPAEVAVATNDFVNVLKKKFPDVPVKRIDERFTSKSRSKQFWLPEKIKKHGEINH